MEAISAIRRRKSVRRYESRKLAQSTVEEIIDCGRLAATANNKQPWLFIAVARKEMRERIAAATDHGKFIADAPVCIAVFCKRAEKYYLEDGAAATQNILVAAKAHGVGTCWIAGDKKEYAGEVREMLAVPEEYSLVSLVSLGYPADNGKRVRKKPLDEVMRWEHY